MRSISAVLVDDHAVVRSALRLLLEREGEIQVVGEAGDADAGLRLIQELRPTVAVVDVALPEATGFAIAEEVIRRDIPTHIVFLSAYDNLSYVVRALEVGASGFVPKSAGERELLTAVREVAAGHPYVPSALAMSLVQAERTGVLRDASPLAVLSPREREVFDLVSAGRTTEEIATLLGISPHTVHRHRSALMRKLGFHDRVELVRFALANEMAVHGHPPGDGS